MATVAMQVSQYRCETCVRNCSWRGRVHAGFVRDRGCASHSAFVGHEQLIERIRLHAPIEGTHKGWVLLSEVENTIRGSGHLEDRQ
ncbi:MAG TPA: hypothetical protein VMT44_05650 [Methanoregula sp.]|nr:hypothetical protein [Methanoregula sp.]